MSKLYGIAASATVPVRKENKDAAEMVTQLLLGESFEVITIQERWVELRCYHDGYEGWVNRNQIRFMDEGELTDWVQNPKLQRSPYAAFRVMADREALLIPLGAKVILHNQGVQIGKKRYNYIYPPIELKEEHILQTAISLLGIPYLWGGRSDLGIDCSGFIQLVYQLHGYYPPRDASQQLNRNLATPVKEDIISYAKEGDIIFFGPDSEKITHIGFYLGEGTLLHASGNVRLDNLSYKMRYQNKHPYNERLAGRAQFIQEGSSLMT